MYFEVEDKEETQKITIEQETTKIEIELIDKITKEKVERARLEIYKAETSKEQTNKPEENIAQITMKLIETATKNLTQEPTTNQEENPTQQNQIQETPKVEIKQGEKIAEVTTTNQNAILNKLPVGTYIIKEQKQGIIEQGYIQIDDQTMEIEDTNQSKKITIEQDHTKLSINLVDKDTKEAVIGGTLTITDKTGKEITQSWVTDGKQKEILKVPVGEYYIEQKAAPTLKGYVKSEKTMIKVEETKERQEKEMLQDYTQITIKAKDETTKEELKEVELVIKDSKGKEVGKINIEKESDTTKQTEKQILKRLAVGNYTVESIKQPYGYKATKINLEIKDKQGIQENEIEIGREEFDLKVEEWVKTIERNGKTEYENKENEQKMKKVDIKDKKIGTEEIKITYKIKISNPSKIRGEVGKIEIGIPSGMIYKQSENENYWREENGKIVSYGLKGQQMQEGDEANIELKLRWKNGLENFGTKEVQVEIKEIKSDNGFEETNQENNKAKTEIIIGVSTGEMNLVYACWILLGILILIEIIVSKKTKIKKFGLKDKTLKYTKKP